MRLSHISSGQMIVVKMFVGIFQSMLSLLSKVPGHGELYSLPTLFSIVKDFYYFVAFFLLLALFLNLTS